MNEKSFELIILGAKEKVVRARDSHDAWSSARNFVMGKIRYTRNINQLQLASEIYNLACNVADMVTGYSHYDYLEDMHVCYCQYMDILETTK